MVQVLYEIVISRFNSWPEVHEINVNIEIT